MECCRVENKINQKMFYKYLNMKVIFYKPLWFLSMFIISLMPLFGQTYISTGSDVCLSTISRNPTGSYPVHYVKTGPYSGKIMFNFVYMNNIYSFKTLPITNYNVNDLTVVGNLVFFCGEDNSGLGFYGVCKKGTGINPPYYFRIFRLYNSTSEYVTDVQRIKVFCEGTDTNVLLIGRYFNNTGNISKNSIIHVKNHLTCTLAYSSVEHYDDVEVLDDYVVTVARKGEGEHPYEPQYLRVLNKSAFSLSDALFDYYYGWGKPETTDRVLLQKTGTNSLVSVFQRENEYYFNTYTVNSGTLQLYNCTQVNPPAQFTNVGDVSYNPSNNVLSIVHNSDTVGYTSLFNCSYYPTVNYINTYKADYLSQNNKDTLTSVARMSSAGFYVTGIKNSKMALWKMPNGCEYSVQCTTSVTESQINKAWGPTVKKTIDTHKVSFSASTVGFPFQEKCMTISGGKNKEEE